MANCIVPNILQWQQRSRRLLAIVGGIALSSCLAVLPAAAESFSSADVTTFQNPDGSPIPPDERDVTGSAILVRSEQGVTINVSTSQLEPGYAYSNWWIIFNHPEACEDGCGADDLGNPDVEASVTYATGRVANADGEAHFSAFLPVGLVRLNRTVEGRERHRLGPGLQNLWGAEIHYIIRSHGPAGPSVATLIEEIGTFNHSCDRAPGCYDAQVIAFAKPH